MLVSEHLFDFCAHLLPFGVDATTFEEQDGLFVRSRQHAITNRSGKSKVEDVCRLTCAKLWIDNFDFDTNLHDGGTGVHDGRSKGHDRTDFDRLQKGIIIKTDKDGSALTEHGSTGECRFVRRAQQEATKDFAVNVALLREHEHSVLEHRGINKFTMLIIEFKIV